MSTDTGKSALDCAIRVAVTVMEVNSGADSARARPEILTAAMTPATAIAVRPRMIPLRVPLEIGRQTRASLCQLALRPSNAKVRGCSAATLGLG